MEVKMASFEKGDYTPFKESAGNCAQKIAKKGRGWYLCVSKLIIDSFHF